MEGVEEDALLETILANSRDNARTPMQWDSSANAGFTETIPWLQVNPNYVDINAAKAVAYPDSVYHHYKQLIGVSNFTSKFVHFDIPEDFLKATKLIGNYHEHNEDSRQKLELKTICILRIL